MRQLELQWFHPAPGPTGRFAFSPLVVDNVMYVVGKDSAVFALDAATGKELWSFATEGTPTNRGFNYWESTDRSDRRIIFASRSYLQQLDARTGKPITSFGVNGLVNLREGLGRTPVPTGGAQSGSPGHVFGNLLVLGSAPGEGYNSPPGDIRAFDVLTGRLVWTFHTIPRPGEFGYDTWPPDAWKTAGGANTWAEFAIDEKRGIGYFPLGSPTFDLWGGDRKGNNLFGNTLLALDLRTGKRLWHYQLLHHDLWDYDLVTGPKLLTVTHNGKPIDIVAQATKFGLLYVFNRVTGQPLWPIEERPVPQSDVPGEQSSATQPFPTRPAPFSRLKFTEADVNPYLDEAERARIIGILQGRAQRRHLYAAQHHEGSDFRSRRAWRRQLGRRRRRSRDGHAVCAFRRPAGPSHAAAAGGEEHGDRRDGAAAALHRAAGDDVLRGEWDECDEPALGAAHRLRSEYRAISNGRRRSASCRRWRRKASRTPATTTACTAMVPS